MTKKTKKIGIITFAAASALSLSVAAGVANTGTTLTVSANTGTVTLGTTEVDLSNFVTYYGASIRANAQTPGLRFKTGIPASEYAKLTAIEGVTLGTLIVPADFLEENEEIKFENLAQDEYADCVAVNFETNDPDKTGNVEFSGVLTKIKDYNINRSFRSRAYIKYQPTSESTPTYYYSNYYSTKAEDTIVETFDNARSVANVAYMASNDTEYTYKDEQYAVFDCYIAYRPNALTEDFERTISDVRAYGVYAQTGTTASILTENALNGNHSLLLDGTDITVAVQTPMLGNIISGSKLTLKATSAVSLTSLGGTAFSTTVSEQTAEGYYNVTLSAEDIAKELNMYSYFAKAILVEGKYPYGNAILSKYPIKNAKTVMIPDSVKRQKNGDYETRCVLVAEIDVLGGITVLVSHFGLMEEEKVNAVQTVLNLVKEIKTPILFMGDLNMKPNDEILQPIFKVLKDTAYGALTPITWPSDVDKATEKGRREPQEEVRKIDYIFASEHFKTKKGETLQSKASDHLPYVVHFEM